MQDAKGLTVKSTSIKSLVKTPLSRGVQLQSLVWAGLVVGQMAVVNSAVSAPVGGVLADGTGSISANGLTTTINQTSARMAIDWQSFNVDVNESVKFIQPSSSAFVLNKILDQSPSSIRGSIEANGNVLLVNPRGIMFTDTATVNVGGLMASGLNIDTADFMNGDFIFDSVDGTSGAVINSGIINASSVALLGKQIANESGAVITAEVVSLSAGDSAVLTFDSDGMMGVQVTKAVLEKELGVDAAVLNSGTVDGQQVLLQASTSEGLFSNAVNNTGIVHAKGIDTSGGTIRLIGSGGSVSTEGTLDASGVGGGVVHLEGSETIVSGQISVDGNEGAGGSIAVLGDQVELTETAILSATGELAGGEILVGGDYQGTNVSVRNATHTKVTAGAEINASGIESGNGGKVIVWADDTTIFYGQIDASSGVNGGDGGFVETSGKQSLIVSGRVVARGASGKNGFWLLDPQEMVIGDIAVDGTTVDVESIISSLESDTDTGFSTTVSDITLKSAIRVDGSGSNGATLTLDAGNNLIIDEAIEGVGNRDSVTLVFSAKSNIEINADIATQDGHITLTADSDGDGVGNLTIANEVSVLTGDENTNGVSGNIAFTAVNLVNYGTVSNEKNGGTEGSLTIDVDTINNQGSIVAADTDVVIDVGTYGGGSNTLGSITANSVTVSALGLVDQFEFSADTSVSFLANTDLSVNGYDIADAEVVNIVSGGDVTASDASETFSVLGSGSLDITSVDGTVRFNGVDSVDAGSNALAPDHIHADSSWSLKGLNAVEVEGISFSNVEAATATGASSVITGQDNVDESYDITGSNILSVDDITLTNISNVDGGVNDTDTVTGDTDWALGGSKTVTASGIAFSNIDGATATGASSAITGQDNTDEDFEITGANNLTVDDIAFTNVSSADGGVNDNDTVTGDSDWTINGSKAVTDGNVAFTNVDAVTATGVSSRVTGDTDWELNGSKAVTASGIAFSNIDGATATGASSAITGQDNTDEDFEITGANSLRVDEISFTNVTSVEGGVNDNDTVTGGSDWTINGSKAVTDGNVAFANVDTVTATGVSSRVTGDTDWELNGSKAVTASGIAFGNIDGATATGASSAITGQDNTDEDFEITGANNLTVDDIAFTNITDAEGGVNDSDTITGDSNWTINSNKAVTDGNVVFTNVDAVTATGVSSQVSGDTDWELNGSKAVTASGMAFSNIDGATATGASSAITGQDSTDEDFEITGANNLTVDDIAFTNVSSVDGGVNDNDTVTGDTDWELNGSKAVTASAMAFSNIDAATATGANSAITGQDNIDESFDISGANDLSVDDIAFTNVSSVEGGVNDNDTVTGNSDWTINGNKAVSDGDVAFTNIDTVTATGVSSRVSGDTDWELNGSKAVTASGIAFSNIDGATATGASSVITGQDNTDEDFEITGANNVTVDYIAFTNVSSVEGGVNDNDTVTGKSDWTINGNKAVSDGDVAFTNIDTVTATGVSSHVSGDTDWELNGSKAVTASGIAFSNIDGATATGASSAITGQDSTDEDFEITGANNLTVDDIAFTNVSSVEGGVNDNDSVTGDSDWTINGSKAVTDGNVAFTNVDAVTATGVNSRVSGDTDWELNGSKAVTASGMAFSNIDGATATGASSVITGQDNTDEDFEITGANSLSVDDIAFTNVTSAEGGVNDNDTVTGDSDWTISGSKAVSDGNIAFTNVDAVTATGVNSRVSGDTDWELNGSKAVTASGMAFSNIDGATATGASSAITGQDNTDEDFEITGANSLSVDDIAFTNVTSAEGGVNDNDTVSGDSDWAINGSKAVSDGNIAFTNVDAVTATGVNSRVTGDTDWELNGSKAVTASGIAFSNIDAATATGASSVITGQDSIDEDFEITGVNNLTVDDIAFTNITSAEGGVNDTDTVSGDSDWTISGSKAVSDGNIAFTNVDAVTATGVNSRVTGDTDWELNGSKAVTASGMAFSNIDGATATGASSVITGQDNIDEDFEITGANNLTVDDIDFTNVSSVEGGVSDTDTVSGDSDWTINGSKAVTDGNVAFTNVDVVTATGVSSRVSGDTDWELNGSKAVTASGMAFSNIDGATATGASSTVTGQDNIDEDFEITGANNLTVDDIAFTNVTSAEGGVNDNDTVSGDSDWTINGSKAVTDGNVAFTNVDTVTATGVSSQVTGDTDWELNGSKAVTASDINFSNVNAITATGSSSILTGNNGSVETYVVSLPNAVTVEGIDFDGITEVRASSDDVLTDVGSHIYTLTSDSLVAFADIDFSGFSFSGFSWGADDSLRISSDHLLDGETINSNGATLLGSAGDDTFTLVDIGQVRLISGEDVRATAGQVLFTNVTAVDALGEGGGDILDGSSRWQLNGSKSLISEGITFSNIENAGRAGVGSTIIGQASLSEDYLVSGVESVQVDDIQFLGVTSVDAGNGASDSVFGGNQWELNGANTISAQGVVFSNINLAGRIGDDSAIVGQDLVGETFSVVGAETIAVDGITFSGVGRVRAGDGPGTEDRVTGASIWQLAGYEQLDVLGINFDEINAAGLSTVNSTLIGQVDIGDLFTVNADNAVSADGIAFLGVQTIDAGAGSGIDQVLGGGTYTLNGDKSLSTHLMTFNNVDQVGSIGDNSTVIGQANVGEHFTMTGLESLEVDNIVFNGVENVLGGEGGAVDSVSGASDWTLVASESVSAQRVQFSEIERIGLNGENYQLNGRSGVADSFSIDGDNLLSTLDMEFVGIAFVVGESADLVNDNGDVSYLLRDNFEAVVNNITISGIELSSYSWSTGDSLGVTDNHQFSGQVVDTKGATLVGSSSDDNYALTGVGQLDYSRSDFTGTGSGAVSFSNVTHVSSEDGAGDTDSVVGGSDWQLRSDRSIAANSIEFSGVDIAGTEDVVSSITGLAGIEESFTILGNQRVLVDSIQFFGVNQVNAGEANGVVDSVSGASDWQLLGSESLSAMGISFNQIEQAGLVGVSSSLSGIDALAESFVITGNQSVQVSDIDFAGIDRVSAGSGTGDSVSGSLLWALQSDGAISAQNIDFYEVNSVGAAGDGSQLLGSVVVGETFEIIGNQQLRVNEVVFNGVESLLAGETNGINDSIIGATDWVLNGSERLLVAGIDVAQVESAGSAGDGSTLTGAIGVDESYTVIGTEQVLVSDISFQGVTSVNAGTLSSGDSLDGAVLYVLEGSESVSANGVRFSDIEFVGQAGENSQLQGRNDIADSFIITASQALSVEGMQFTGVNSASGGSGTALDSVQGAQSWTLLGDQQVSASGIEFSQIEQVGALGDNATLTGQSDVGETFVISGAGLVSAGNIEFLGVNTVTAGSGAGIDAVEGSSYWTINGDKSVSAEGITFNEIDLAGDVGGAGHLVGLVAADDSFTIDGERAVTSSGISFVGITQVDAGDVSGVDSVQGGSTWSLLGEESVAANEISFVNVEQVGAAGDASSLIGQADVSEDYELLNDQSLRVEGIVFDGLSQVNAGNGTGVDTARGASEWQLLTGDSVRGNSIVFDGVDSFGQLGDDSHLIGQQGVSETFEIVGENRLRISDTQFNGVVSVVAGNTGGEDLVHGASEWSIEENQSVSAEGMNFAEIEFVGLAGESNHLIGQSNIDETYEITGEAEVSVYGVSVRGVSELSAGSNDQDQVIGLDGEQWLLKDLNGDGVNETLEAQTIAMTGIDSATSSGTASLTATDNDETFTVEDNVIEVSNIVFDNLTSIDARGGSDNVLNTLASQWTAREQGGALVNNSLEGLINSVSVVFSNIESVTNVGLLIGADQSTEYRLIDANSLELAGVEISGVSELRAGAGNDQLIGTNLDAVWTLDGGSGSVDGLTFSNIESFQAGSGTDTFYLTNGSVAEVRTGGGDDTVYLEGGSAMGIYLESGDDQIFLSSELSLIDRLDGGSGSDSLTSSLANATWVINSPVDGVNRLGSMEFTQIENLSNTAANLAVESSLAAVFSNSDVRFSNGLRLQYINTGDIGFISHYVGSNGLSGSVTADHLDLLTQTDVDLNTDINSLGITAINDASIDVFVSELNDLVVTQIDTGSNGILELNSKSFGLLTAEARGDTHILAKDVVLGTNAERWSNIGEQLNPLRMDVSNTLNIVSLSYVNPEFVSQVPTVNATGERVESIAGVVASQGLKSAVKNEVVEFTQVDPAIFTDVSSYSVSVDAVFSPESRLVAGELIPAAATAVGTSKERDLEIEEEE